MSFDIQGMLAQAQQMQEEMSNIEEEVKEMQVSAEAGGGMVKVTINGMHDILSLKISKEVIDPADSDLLEDLILSAINKANKEARKAADSKKDKLQGMLPNIPGLNLGL